MNVSAKSVAAFSVAEFLLLVVGPCSVVLSVPAGHIGVVSSFGEVSSGTLSPGGPYFVKPWKHVTRMSVRTQKNDEPATVPTENGLSVKMNAVLLFRLDAGKAPEVLKAVGEKCEERVITPMFRSAVRDVCAEFDPEALYTSDRTKVETGVLAKVTKGLGERGFVVESVMLPDPVLPDVVVNRIRAKVGAERDALRMESVLRQKKLEADAKIIEAKGIAGSQAIVKKDLDDNCLKYLWIEALKESAKHNNATIYIPTGHDGMPFFKEAAPKK